MKISDVIIREGKFPARSLKKGQYFSTNGEDVLKAIQLRGGGYHALNLIEKTSVVVDPTTDVFQVVPTVERVKLPSPAKESRSDKWTITAKDAFGNKYTKYIGDKESMEEFVFEERENIVSVDHLQVITTHSVYE